MTEVVEIDQKELQNDQVIQHTASGEESAAASEELSVQAAQMLEMMMATQNRVKVTILRHNLKERYLLPKYCLIPVQVMCKGLIPITSGLKYTMAQQML